MTDVGEGTDHGPGSRGGTRPDRRSSPLQRFEASAVGGLGEDPRLLPDQWCRSVADVLGADGVAISVNLDADLAVPIGASDVPATRAEALQFTLGEGPCLDAYSSRCPVLTSDVQRPDSPARWRWPTYAAELTRRTPYRAVFAFPLLSGGAALGSLSAFHRAAGQPRYLDVLSEIAAWIAARMLEADMIAADDRQPGRRWVPGPAGRRRQQVWVAQGLVLASNWLTPGQALDLLRAQAFSAGRLLDDIADDIVAGRLPVPALHS